MEENKPQCCPCVKPAEFEPGASGLEVVRLAGLTLETLEKVAILSAHSRHSGPVGRRRKMMEELGISKSCLLRHLTDLGLRKGGIARPPKKRRFNARDW
jgi:hypothetical protein